MILLIILLVSCITLASLFLYCTLKKRPTDCSKCKPDCPGCSNTDCTNVAVVPHEACSSDNQIDTACCPMNSVVVDSSCTTQGNNPCALELILSDNSGSPSHMTIAYIYDCSKIKGKEKEFINDVILYIKNNWTGTPVLNVILGNKLGLNGSGFDDCQCILGDLAQLKYFVMEYLASQKYCLEVNTWGILPHTEVFFDKDGKPPGGNTCFPPNKKTIDVTDKNNWKVVY